MTLRTSLLFPLVGLFIGLLLGGVLTTSRPPVWEGVLFSTLIAADEGSSISEKEGASNFFAETLVGWTHSPAFQSEVFDNASGGFTAQKQERQNIVFTLSGSTEEEVKTLSSSVQLTVNTHLHTFNTASKTQYQLLFSPLQTYEKTTKSIFGLLAGGIFGFFGGLLLLPLLEWGRRAFKKGL